MNNNIVRTILFTSCLPAFIFSGCSSSSSDDSDVPADAITINSKNALDTVINGKNTVDSLIGSAGDTIDAVFNKTSGTESATNPVRLSEIAVNLIRNQKLTNSTTNLAPVTDYTVNCDSGNAVLNGNYEDTGTVETVSGTIDFNNCAYNNVTINGSIDINTVDTEIEPFRYATTGSESNGNLTITVASVTHTVSGYTSNWSDNDVTNEYSEKSSYTFSSPAINGSIVYGDTLTWKGIYLSGGPYQGSGVITGANNAKIKITALDNTQFELEVDADGDNTYEYSQVYAWSVLDN